MVYHAIGIAGNSTAADLVFASFQETAGNWHCEILASEHFPLSGEWEQSLRTAATADVPAFLRLHQAFGLHIGNLVNIFISAHNLEYKVAVVGFCGFPVQTGETTFWLGNGAAVAAITALPVVTDFYGIDQALGGKVVDPQKLSSLLQSDPRMQVPDAPLLAGLMAVLRWREAENTFASETGASANTVGGAMWLGQAAD